MLQTVCNYVMLNSQSIGDVQNFTVRKFVLEILIQLIRDWSKTIIEITKYVAREALD